MKTIRSIGIFLLAAALCAGFTGCVPLGRMVAERMEESIMDFKDASTFTAGNFTYAASDVRRVSVRWIDGSVTLKPGTGTLHADESGVLSAPQQMHWRIKDGTLEIMYCASGYIGRFPSDSKALTLEIPAGVDVTVNSLSAPVYGSALHVGALALTTLSGAVHLETVTAADIAVKSTSGAVGLTDVTAADLHLGSTSGAVGLTDVTAADLHLGSTSGRVDLAGETRADALHVGTVSGAVDAEQLEARTVDVSTVSGSVKLGLAAAADVDIDTTSGAVRLTVPTAIGATFRYKTVSGSLHCDDYRVKGGTSVFGEGGCTAAVSTVSGSLTVTDK